MHTPIIRTLRTLVSALVATAHFSALPWKRGNKLTPLLALALLGPALIGCRPTAERSEGVELVLSSSAPTPTMTFELRFNEAMVGERQVGVPVTNSPLVIAPPLAGAFTWLNTRSGTFTPSEPLALDTRYDLRLRPGLRCADGRPAKAALDRTLTTPPLDIIAFVPRHPDTNATSEPEVKLAFNADVRAPEAERFLYFRDQTGRRIPAEVRQATVEEIEYPLGSLSSLRTWKRQFTTGKDASSFARASDVSDNPTNQVENVLIATPGQALPLGNGWRLVASAGAPAQDGSMRLRHSAEVPVGDVTPFVATAVAANHYVNSPPWVRLSFSKPVPDLLTNDLASWVEVAPAVANITATTGWGSVTLIGDFKGNTWYTLKLRPGFESTEPFKLSGSNTFTVKMPRVAPRLYFPAFSGDQLAGGNRSFPLMAVNVAQVRVRAKLLDPQTAIHALRGYGSYFATWNERQESGTWEEPYRAVNYNVVPGRTIFNEELELRAQPDTTQTLDLSWDRMLGGRKTGVVLLDASRTRGEADTAPALGTQALIQLTDLGLEWKKAPTGVDVFVFSHASGRPVPGATARLFSDENEPLREALTDASGVAHLATDTNAAWVAAQLGDDFHAALLKEDRVWLYHYDLPATGSDEQESPYRVMLFSDRDDYRPGEELHLAALVREWSDQGLRVPPTLAGTLTCHDPRGRQFFQTNAAFTASGAWSAQVPLPLTARGHYTAHLHLGTNEYIHPFSVHDFQPSAFEISLNPKPVYGADEKIGLPVSARYLFGKQLSSARVEWSLEAYDSEFKPERFKGFTFYRREFGARWWGKGSSVQLSGQGTLSGATNFVIAPELPANATAPQPRTVSLLVEVTDLNQQTLSHRVDFMQHSSEFYLGLLQGAEVLNADETQPLEIVAVRPDGQPWLDTVKAQVTLQRVDWQTVRIQGAGKTIRYRNEAVLTNVFQTEIEVAPIALPADPAGEVRGNRLPGLPLLPAGHYVIEASAKDSGGRVVVSSLNFDVSARAELGSNYRNDVQLTLKPDHKSYTPGQTAEILVEAPFSGTALVSVEREKVLRSFTTRLEGNAPAVRVPLGPGDVPNVFVSVTLVRGADECPRKVKEPEYRIGYCELAVADPQSRLDVQVTPAATNYLPAQTVEVTVQVTGVGGEAVSGADVVLYAVDDGVLQLSGYGVPDPHACFYASRPLGVQTSISLPNLLTEDSEELRFQNKGYLGGGGGMERVRKNFLACAFWNAVAHHGRTRQGPRPLYRPRQPDAVPAVRGGPRSRHRFGSGAAAFQVSKPLVIEPALPAIANITDHLVARGLVQNQTPNAGEVLVTLALDDKAKADGAERSVQPAGDSACQRICCG